MNKAKIIFGLLALTIFSLSFVSNNSSDNDDQQEETILKSRYKPPTNG